MEQSKNTPAVMTPTQPSQAVDEALSALSAAAFAHPSASDPIGVQCSAAEKRLRAELASPQEVAAVGDAMSEIEDAIKFYGDMQYERGPDEVPGSFAEARRRLKRALECIEKHLLASQRVPVALPAEPVARVDLPDRVVDVVAQSVNYRFNPSQAFYDFAQALMHEVIARVPTPAPKQGGAKDAIEIAASRLYGAWTDNQGIHCNRFSGWAELDPSAKKMWLERAAIDASKATT